MRFASAIPVALVGLALASAEDEGGRSRPKRLAVLCPPVDNESDVGQLPATCSPGEMTTNVDLLVFEGSAYEFAFAASQDPNHCFGSVLTISSHADKEVDYGDMNSEMLFSAFLDDETRSQLSDYDALAVIPSSALSKNDDPSFADPVVSVDVLYSLAFDGQTDNPDDDFWVKSLSRGEGGGVGGSGFSGDGAAIYNNDDESFVSYVRAADGKRRQQQEELSGEEAVTTMNTFGAALMYTLEDPLYGDYPAKFVTGDLVSAEDEGGRSRPKRLAVLCPPVDNESDVGQLPATCSPGEMTTNVDLLVFEGSAYEFAFAASQDPNHCFGSVLTISSHADKEVDYGDMNSEMLFSAFLDDETRSQLSDYDALAVIPSSALSKNDDPSFADPVVSVDVLYSLAFDGQTDNPDDDFWVKSLSRGEGGGVGGSGFSGDGAAIYNNDDESFVSYVRAADGKRRQQQQEELSGEEAVTAMDTFGAVLMHALEDPLYGDYPAKFVTGDLLSYGGGSSDYDFKTEYQHNEGSSNYHFKAGYHHGSSNNDFNVDLHDTGISDEYDFKEEHQFSEPKWKAAEKWRGDPENGVQPKWQEQEKWRGDPENGIEPKWKSNGCFDGCTHTSHDGTKGRVCDLSCKTGEPYGTYGCAAKSRKYGLSCRRCYNDVAKALKNDTPQHRAIMCDTLEPPSTYSARRLEESDSEPSPAAELARLLQKYMRKRDDESRDEIEERRPE